MKGKIITEITHTHTHTHTHRDTNALYQTGGGKELHVTGCFPGCGRQKLSRPVAVAADSDQEDSFLVNGKMHNLETQFRGP
jgi:hypothetical protein